MINSIQNGSRLFTSLLHAIKNCVSIYLNSNSEDKILKGSHQDIFDM